MVVGVVLEKQKSTCIQIRKTELSVGNKQGTGPFGDGNTLLSPDCWDLEYTEANFEGL